MTANDNRDLDGGGNNLQNFPVLSTISASGANNMSVYFTFNSTPSTTFTIYFFSNEACHRSLHGQGEWPIGSTTVTTNTAGSAAKSVTLPRASQWVTALAVAPNGDTSEFSRCGKAPSGADMSAGISPLSTSGSTVTYRFRVRNAGPDAAANVSTTVTLPNGATLGSVTSIPAGWTCGAQVGQSFTCTRAATMAAGTSATFQFTANFVTVADGRGKAQISVTSTTPDPVPGNNSAAETATLP